VTVPDRGLVLDGLATRAGTFALSPIDIRVNPGSVLAVLGPSGAGKTMLLDTIAGFRTATHGRVILAGRDLTPLAPEQRRIGVVFQHAALFPHLSVRENVCFGPKARGDRHPNPADALLAQFGLAGHADRRPRSLSGGERQRVSLARALATDPDLLLLDEPLSALDQPTREELRGVLAELLTGLGIPAIHVTHDRDEALILGDHVAVIVAGRLRQLDTGEQISAHPADADVARLLGWTHLGTGRVDRGAVTLGDLRLTVPGHIPAGAETLSIFYRPEGVLLTQAHPPPTAATIITRTIDEVLPTTPLARVHIGGDPPLAALILHRELTRLDLRPGQHTHVALPPDSITTFTN
jgi:ABC-type sulfate/molybdate transport systems ATPase subunit